MTEKSRSKTALGRDAVNIHSSSSLDVGDYDKLRSKIMLGNASHYMKKLFFVMKYRYFCALKLDYRDTRQERKLTDPEWDEYKRIIQIVARNKELYYKLEEQVEKTEEKYNHQLYLVRKEGKEENKYKNRTDVYGYDEELDKRLDELIAEIDLSGMQMAE